MTSSKPPLGALPVAEILPLDSRFSTTRGCTARLDAIVHTIETVGQGLAQTQEPGRPGRVIVAIRDQEHEPNVARLADGICGSLEDHEDPPDFTKYAFSFRRRFQTKEIHPANKTERHALEGRTLW